MLAYFLLMLFFHLSYLHVCSLQSTIQLLVQRKKTFFTRLLFAELLI